MMSDSYWLEVIRGCEGFADAARVRHMINTSLGPSEESREILLLALDRVHSTLLEKSKELRKDVLLRAAYDILTNIDNNHESDALATTAIWDDSVCDGYCLLEELQDILGEE